MSPHVHPEHLLDLAADRALVGLSGAEALELERLLESHGEDEALRLELAAAELDLAFTGSVDEHLPDSLRGAISDAGHLWLAAVAARQPTPAAPAQARPTTQRARVLALAGWAVAAAALIMAVLGWMPRRLPIAPSTASPAQAYASLRDEPGTLNPTWEATEFAPGARGDVAWSQAEQQGFLHIIGLAPNDPRVEQYQLWILDGDQKHPIDGGVFDLRGEEQWIPIDPKLRVQSPTAFAVTIESPGGVVVSDQERVVLLAKL